MFLYSTPEVRIRDFFAKADLDSAYKNGKFSLDVDLKNKVSKLRSENYKVSYQILDANNSTVASDEMDAKINRKEDLLLTFSKEIENPLKWTAETPNLYSLVVTLKNSADETVDVITSYSIHYTKLYEKPVFQNHQL